MNDNKASMPMAGFCQSFLKDLLASIVVFLVALPLCMGIAIASGVPSEKAAAVGIISGIVGGLVVGLVAGSPLQVTGPAAGLAVIVGQLIVQYGFETLGLIMMVGGVVQILAGLLGLGQWFRAVSPAVIQGMLAGIGMLIFAAQFHVMVDDRPPGGGKEFGGIINLWTIPEAVWKGLSEEVHQPAAFLGVVTIVAIVGWGALAPKKLKLFPAPLVGVLVAMLAAGMAGLQPKYPAGVAGLLHHDVSRLLDLSVEQKKQIRDILRKSDGKHGEHKNETEPAQGRGNEVILRETLKILSPSQQKTWKDLERENQARRVYFIDVPDNLATSISLPTWANFGLLFQWSILAAGLTLAFVASAESLLTATAADAMQQHAPRTKYGRELAAQGIGNLLCGLLGALPVTGVIVRTGANIQAGARTRLATMLHGLWLLIFAVLFPFVLRLIPVSSLAAILVYTGWKLMNPKAVRQLWQYGKWEVTIYAATLATVVIVDLLTGILVGVALAVAQLVHTFSHLRVRLREENGRTLLYLQGAATFIRLPKLAAVLEKVKPSTELHVHFEELTYIDHACLDLLMTWEKQHEATGGSLVIDWESLTARFRRFATRNGKTHETPAVPPEKNDLTGATASTGQLEHR